MIWRTITYEHLNVIFLLLVIPFFIFGYIRLNQYRREKLNTLGSPHVLEAILLHRRPLATIMKSFLFTLAWAAAVIALMGPQGNGRYREYPSVAPSKTPIQEVIFLIDTSASMGVNDVYGGRSRLEYAKDVVAEVIKNLQGENIALYAFTSMPMKMVPSTNDYFFARLMLRGLTLNEGDTSGTDLYEVIKGLNEDLSKEPKLKPKTVILLSDGGDTIYEASSAQMRIERIDKIVKEILLDNSMNVRLAAVGIGSEAGGQVPGVTYQGQPVHSKVQDRLLTKISSTTEEPYLSSEGSNPAAIGEQLVKRIRNHARDFAAGRVPLEARSIASSGQLIYDSYDQIPLGIALVALMLMLTIPSTSVAKRILPILIIAFGQIDAEMPEMAQAQAFWEAGDYQAAKAAYQEVLDDPLDPWQKAILYYDMGTVYLAEQDYEGALNQYQKVQVENDELPLLQKRLAFNTALAQLMLVKNAYDNPNFLSKASFEEMLRAKKDLQRVYRFIQLAAQKECLLKKAEGAPNCETNLKNSSLEAEARRIELKIFDESLQKYAVEASALNLKNKDLEVFLKSLSLDYAFALNFNPLQQVNLINLEKLASVGKPLLNEEFQQTYKDSIQELNLAQEALKKEKFIEARFHIELGWYLIKSLIFRSGIMNKEGAQNLLQWAIDEQASALDLNELLIVIPESPTSQKRDTILEIQQGALSTIKEFLASAKALQGETGKHDIDWEEIIPLVVQGENKAKAAQKLIENKNRRLQATVMQLEALKAWNKALELMRRKQAPNETESPKDVQNQMTKAQDESIFELIQSLEEEDKSIQQFRWTPQTKKVERPW